MDASLLIAAGASFVIGMTAYIIVKFWVRPIVRYLTTKSKLKSELTQYLARINDQAISRKKGSQDRGQPTLRRARKHIMALVAYYGEEIPYWYRLLLESRQESPTDALGLLTNLPKKENQEQKKDRINKVNKKLGLK